MRAEFEYNQMVVSGNILEVEDIGNVIIHTRSITGEERFLIIRTHLGISYIFTYGPIIPSITKLPDSVVCRLDKLKYNDKRLQFIISNFINDDDMQVVEILDNQSDALKYCRDLIKYMEDYSED